MNVGIETYSAGIVESIAETEAVSPAKFVFSEVGVHIFRVKTLAIPAKDLQATGACGDDPLYSAILHYPNFMGKFIPKPIL